MYTQTTNSGENPLLYVGKHSQTLPIRKRWLLFNSNYKDKMQVTQEESSSLDVSRPAFNEINELIAELHMIFGVLLSSVAWANFKTVISFHANEGLFLKIFRCSAN